MLRAARQAVCVSTPCARAIAYGQAAQLEDVERKAVKPGGRLDVHVYGTQQTIRVDLGGARDQAALPEADRAKAGRLRAVIGTAPHVGTTPFALGKGIPPSFTLGAGDEDGDAHGAAGRDGDGAGARGADGWPGFKDDAREDGEDRVDPPVLFDGVRGGLWGVELRRRTLQFGKGEGVAQRMRGTSVQRLLRAIREARKAGASGPS